MYPAKQEVVENSLVKPFKKVLTPTAAIGAAIQGGVLTGEGRRFSLLDASPRFIRYWQNYGWCNNRFRSKPNHSYQKNPETFSTASDSRAICWDPYITGEPNGCG